MNTYKTLSSFCRNAKSKLIPILVLSELFSLKRSVVKTSVTTVSDNDTEDYFFSFFSFFGGWNTRKSHTNRKTWGLSP